MDKSLTFRHHFVVRRKNISPRRVVALSSMYLTAKYASHARLMNSALNIVIGCLRPTPTGVLPILSGINPAELCQLNLSLTNID